MPTIEKIQDGGRVADKQDGGSKADKKDDGKVADNQDDDRVADNHNIATGQLTIKMAAEEQIFEDGR